MDTEALIKEFEAWRREANDQAEVAEQYKYQEAMNWSEGQADAYGRVIDRLRELTGKK